MKQHNSPCMNTSRPNTFPGLILFARPIVAIGFVVCLGLVLCLGFVGPVMAHPFHASIAEAEFNADSGKLEVALRLHPVDLEAVLREKHGKSEQTPSSP